MNDADRRLLRDWGDQLTPTIDANYDLLEKFERVPMCVACPMAQWYRLEDKADDVRLECFCTAFHSVMYGGGRVVTACDARVDALKPSTGSERDG